MSETFPYADIIILALIAAFILLRLRGILGQNPADRADFFAKPPAIPAEPIVQVNEKSLKAKPNENDPRLVAITDPAIMETLQSIKAKDPQFNLTAFMGGAKLAFEMVFDAFAKGDKETLKKLLSDALYQHFSSEIDAKATALEAAETTLVSVSPKDISHASLQGVTARLGVTFLSEQVMLVRDGKGAIIEGNASDIHHAENEWTFERDITSKNPNWKIVET